MDPIFLAYASFGVFVFGISKGGVPGPVAMLAVPVMSFAMSPLQAAGILLPLLIIMDFSAIYLYWKKWINSILKIVIPASIIGILFGTLNLNLKYFFGRCKIFLFISFYIRFLILLT